jgi:hypothetical protein
MRSAHLSVADDAEFELATAIGHSSFHLQKPVAWNRFWGKIYRNG